MGFRYEKSGIGAVITQGINNTSTETVEFEELNESDLVKFIYKEALILKEYKIIFRDEKWIQ